MSVHRSLAAGPAAPVNHEQEDLDLLPLLGRALFQAGVRWALPQAEVRLHARLTGPKPKFRRRIQEEAEEIASWAVLVHTLRKVDEAVGSQCPPALEGLCPPLEVLPDPWAAFAAIAAWLHRERDILRLLPHEFAEEIGQKPPGQTSPSTPPTREELDALVDRCLRDTKPDVPFERFRIAVEKIDWGEGREEVALATLATTWRESIYARFPSEALLTTIPLCMLRVGVAGPCPRGRIEALDSVFRSVAREVRWKQFADWHAAASATEQAAFFERLLDHLGSFTEIELRMLQNGPPRAAELPGVAAAARAVFAEISSELRNLLSTATVATLEADGEAFARPIANSLQTRLQGIHVFPGWVPSCVEGAQFLNVCQQALGRDLQPLLASIEAAPSLTREVIVRGLREVFLPLAKWEVAVAIDGVGMKPDARGSDVVFTAEELRLRWGADVFLARPGEVYALVTDVEASDHYEASARGLLKLDIALAAAWLDWRGHHQFEVGPVALMRTTGARSSAASTKPTVWALQLGSTKVAQMTAELRGVLDGLHGPQKPLWYRLGAALLHVRDAGKTKAPHRRFSALWFALEALFDNLDIDEDASVGSAGGRVSARVAALQPPDDWMGAMTYEQVRAFHADLAFGLYKLRNLAVHEGDLTPAVDDVAADQLEQLALLAVHTVLANARSGHLRRVEEVIAHCIYITPSNSLAKRPPES